MKLLAIADLHAEEEVLDRLRMHATKGNYGFILVAGDITNSEGPVSYALELIEILGKQAYYVHGNNDNLQVQHALESTGRSVHARKTKIGKWNLAGFGGSNKTPFATPCEYTEGEIAAGLGKAGVDEFTILMTHCPAYGLFDSIGETGVHVGSKEIRKTIEAKKPILNICGHVHETSGHMLNGETMVVKIPPAVRLLGTEISITDTIEVKNIRL